MTLSFRRKNENPFYDSSTEIQGPRGDFSAEWIGFLKFRIQTPMIFVEPDSAGNYSNAFSSGASKKLTSDFTGKKSSLNPVGVPAGPVKSSELRRFGELA